MSTLSWAKGFPNEFRREHAEPLEQTDNVYFKIAQHSALSTECGWGIGKIVSNVDLFVWCKHFKTHPDVLLQMLEQGIILLVPITDVADSEKYWTIEDYEGALRCPYMALRRSHQHFTWGLTRSLALDKSLASAQVPDEDHYCWERVDWDTW